MAAQATLHRFRREAATGVCLAIDDSCRCENGQPSTCQDLQPRRPHLQATSMQHTHALLPKQTVVNVVNRL